MASGVVGYGATLVRRKMRGCGEFFSCEDELDRARRFFVMAWQGYGGPRKEKLTGWKIQKRKWESGRCDQVEEWNLAKRVLSAAQRLREVQIESDDALRVIRRFDTPKTLFYCDPPYPANTRNRRWCKRAYNHELGGMDHVHLANLLNQIEGTAVISSYPNELYDELFASWRRVERTAQTMNKTIATEVLYLHPKIAAGWAEGNKAGSEGASVVGKGSAHDRSKREAGADLQVGRKGKRR
jgi:DNA adenine methylase